ncbi:LANO_0B05116g1_1 [Lachancea nothofagi CBS 11611]|uniref:LANO_0B05116g1_1 n=1 Tax=Lachancea nothofagi CBS 11611 TaxID=1266666 RepID=A0A1G4IY57_9SACH|nr:LANO_0B05116g1_1 [Lachancea nothofagi CBS 11611]
MDENGASQIIGALEVIYSAKSDNARRLEAQKFLDEVKVREESPLWGYEIALNNPGNSILKHFGLGLLAYAIQRKWGDYTPDKKVALRKWVVELNCCVQNSDPRYIKEKLAFLWVEIAKRVWGEALKEDNPTDETLQESWADMDNNLSELWHLNESARELTLIIFRTLFEDVFLLEDLTVLKRISVIQPLCVMVISPMDVFAARYRFTDKWTLFKSNGDGWFELWVSELRGALTSGNTVYVVRLLETLKTCLNWPLSEIMIRNDVCGLLLECLLSNIPKAQSMALDSLHILLTRPYNDDSHYQTVINKVFSSMDLLDKVYDNLLFDPNDIDESKYPIVKKFVDMVSCLYTCVFKIDEDEVIIQKYLRLVLRTTFNPSLIVSGLTLDLWCSCLRNDDFLPALEKTIIPELLQFSADALIYYEQIEGHVSKKFADIDFQSTSEFQSFCSTYRKRIRDIIRLISCVQLDFAYDWLNARLNAFFSSPFGQQVLNSQFLDHKTEPYLSALSQLMVVECFINGCIRWKIWYPDSPAYNDKLNDILTKIETLSDQLIALTLREPLLLKKQIQNFALFLTMLKDNVLLKLLEKIITSATLEYPNVDLDEKNEQSDAVRDLRYACGIELNRMAILMPDSLSKIFNELQNVVAGIMPRLSYHEKISFKSFLLTIVLKSSLGEKEERFTSIVDPELTAWSDKETVVGLTDLPWFMERLGIVQISEYFQKRGFNGNDDLLSIPIDEEGKQLKTHLSKRWQTLFPVRATRMFVHYSMQSIKNDAEFEVLQSLWKPRVVPILPYIMRLLYQLQSYHDPENWKELPIVVQSFVKCSTVERFWEAGASNKSKDEFIDEHMKAMQTLRDFADSVGHIVRYTREYVLLVISAMSSFGSIFYDIDELPQMLMDSIAIYKPSRREISPGVSTHGWKHIINVAIRPLLKNCPPQCSKKFMTAFLPKLFDTLDVLLCQKWSVYMNDIDVNPPPRDDDEMTEEILEENLLRQLTTVVVRLLIDCVGQVGTNSQASKMKLNSHQIEMRKIIFGNTEVMNSFLRLLNHLMSFRDSKCSFNSILVMKSCLVDTLIKTEATDQFFTMEIMPNLLLNVLTQNAFKDSLYEGLYVFTVIFLTLCKEYKSSRDFLCQLSQGFDVEALYENVRSVENYKNQRALMVEFIDWIKTVNGQGTEEQDEDDKKRQEKRQAILERANERLIKQNKEQKDLLDDPNTEDGAFGSLFQ